MSYQLNSLTAMVDISTYCNASCPQCHRTDQEDISKKNYWLPLVQWDLDTFQKRFPANTLINYRQIVLCGTWGDPIMNKNIYSIVEYILSSTRSTNIFINTNGSMRDELFWWELGMLDAKYGYRLTIVFDIDGTTQEQHEIYRRGTDLKKVLANMRSYTESGSMAKAFTVVFKHNENSLEEIGDLAKKNGAKFLYICPSNRFDKNYERFRFISNGQVETLYPSKLKSFKEIKL